MRIVIDIAAVVGFFMVLAVFIQAQRTLDAYLNRPYVEPKKKREPWEQEVK